MRKIIVAFLTCFTAAALLGQETEPLVQLHGFGEWDYGVSDGNVYLDGRDGGDYDNIGFGLNARSNIGERLSVIGQLALRTRGNKEATAELDYALAQWTFSDALILRVGRSKHPFGIYTEIYDIGTLRPFFHLPQSVYGTSEIAAQSYNGMGITGNRGITSGTSMDYDLYAGQITFDTTQWVEGAGERWSGRVNDALGGRIRVHTPVDGLSFGASAYTGKVEPEDEETEGGDEGGHEEPMLREGARHHRGYGVQLEYAALPLTIRSEVGQQKEHGEGKTTALYLEGSYRFGRHFELAGRYDHFTFTPEEAAAEGEKHTDLALGANYWFNPEFVLKLSVHHVRGFAVASPVEGNGDDTNALFFGAQFSF